MTHYVRTAFLTLIISSIAAGSALLLPFAKAMPKAASAKAAMPKADSYWNVDELRPGMKGTGRTVIKGTKIESFDAEVLGVLKNTSPGRDMVLCKLSGLGLDKTGVIQGMSGSPIYVQDKLVGAVAYAWPFGKEPLAGVTPFSQMSEFVASYEKRDLAEKVKASRVGLQKTLRLDGREFDTVTVSQDFIDPTPATADGIWMVPLRTPIMATGMSPGSLALLREKLASHGLVPVQGGGVGGNIPDEERNAAIVPGAALTVAMVTGDFDMSGIGTVTHVEGKRVYGWGHPFLGAGSCDIPLMTGYVHAICSRYSNSFKMGSPLKTVGVINADVSTCIAGWLDRQPDLLPVTMSVVRDASPSKTFNVKIVRQRSLLAGLLQSVLTNSVDMEGDLPDEMTALMKVRIDVEGRPTILISDLFSGSTLAGNRAPQALFSTVGLLVNQMNFNSFANLRINKVECVTEIMPGRRTADIEAVQLESDTYAPGDTVKATVILRTFKGGQVRVPVSLTLPADLPEGAYAATVSDDLANARQELRDNPLLANPQNIDQLWQSLQVILGAKRTNLVVRLPIQGGGVAVNGKALPDLPGSMVQILGNSRRTGALTINSALVSRQPTDWVIAGADALRFTVAKNKKFSE
ncbi:MAG: SpoIVB peptidase S55 [Planctomycetes bacterium]|nr:SpoIVB peptidase S55 [Planctomycetota bacterium]